MKQIEHDFHHHTLHEAIDILDRLIYNASQTPQPVMLKLITGHGIIQREFINTVLPQYNLKGEIPLSNSGVVHVHVR